MPVHFLQSAAEDAVAVAPLFKRLIMKEVYSVAFEIERRRLLDQLSHNVPYLIRVETSVAGLNNIAQLVKDNALLQMFPPPPNVVKRRRTDSVTSLREDRRQSQSFYGQTRFQAMPLTPMKSADMISLSEADGHPAQEGADESKSQGSYMKWPSSIANAGSTTISSSLPDALVMTAKDVDQSLSCRRLAYSDIQQSITQSYSLPALPTQHVYGLQDQIMLNATASPAAISPPWHGTSYGSINSGTYD